MFSRLFCRGANDNAASLNPIDSRPHGGPAAFAYRQSEDQDQRDFACASLAAEIFLAEDEQKLLKQRGDVAKIIRRQKGRYFNPQKTPEIDSRASSFDSLVDEEGLDWSPATVWAAGLQSDPLWLDAVERESVSPPNWAVTTAIEAIGGDCKPVIFDWLKPQKSPKLLQVPQSSANFVAWCENLMNSAFGLTNRTLDNDSSDEAEDESGNVDAGNNKVENKADRKISDSFGFSCCGDNFDDDDDLPLRVDELDDLSVLGYSLSEEGYAVSLKSFQEVKPAKAVLHQGYVVHQAPMIEANCAVIALVSG